MPRLPEPLTEEGLVRLIQDERYWQSWHPDYRDLRDTVREGYRRLFSDRPPERDAQPNADREPATTGGVVHVRAHTRVVDGKVVQVQAHDRSAPWRARSNPGFRERIAEAESSANKPNHGYGERNAASGALGRYQMMPRTLLDIRWKDAGGRWTDRARANGVTNDREFLTRPEAQEAAMDDLLRRYEAQGEEQRLFDRVGQKIRGRVAEITVTEAGIIAAVHRGGADGTRRYLEKIDRAGGDSRRATLTKDEEAIETRLRRFQNEGYSRVQRR